MRRPHSLFSHASRLHAQGKLAEAKEVLLQVVNQQPGHADAWAMLGAMHMANGDCEHALRCFGEVMALQPGHVQAHFNAGNACKALGRFDEAIAHYDTTLALQPDHAQACNNRGNVWDSLGRADLALQSYDQALAWLPGHALILNNRAGTLKDLGRLDEALLGYEQAFSADPAQAFVLGQILSLKMQICDWSQLSDAVEAYRLMVGAGRQVGLPFPALSLLDDPLVHQQVSQIYAATQHATPAVASRAPSTDGLAHPGRVCIGYFSANFYDHATAALLAELIEVHDRSQFDIVGFSWGSVRQDAMRARLVAAFDVLYDLSGMNDAEAAAFSRKRGVDIAVDLDGYTQGARPGVFAHRCGAVQLAYLGFPGTTGAAHMDYIVADGVVLPAEQHRYYTEKVVTLPCCYQVNDSRRPIATRVPTRQEMGLPDGAFVYCCFNNNYKIGPATFACWMRILHKVPGAVLWLLEDNPWAAHHLREAAQAAGIAPERLVFAGRMPGAAHLARHRLADVFLDTWPYNAHTTASDALWAGLPVLTCVGQSFASRVAASLLQALHLPELIATNEWDFEAKAVCLANDAQALAQLKATLQRERVRSPLFAPKLFAQHLERAFLGVWERHVAGLAPQSLTVPPG